MPRPVPHPRPERPSATRPRPALAALAAAALAWAGPLAAQQEDEAAVLAVIDRMFEGMRTNDGDMVRSTFVEGATLVSTEDREGGPATQLLPVERFASAVDGATIPWDEPYWDPIVQIRDHLATAWVKYAFYAGEDFSHCGVDAFMLARQADGGWKIVALADTRQREDCEMPPGR